MSYCTKVNISVQVVHYIDATHENKVTKQNVQISFVYLLFMTILRCPSLVGIAKLSHGNLLSL